MGKRWAYSNAKVTAAVVNAVVDEGEQTVAVLFKQDKVRITVAIQVEGGATYRVNSAAP